MAIHTVHLILGVLLINFIFGLGTSLGDSYVNGTTNINGNLTHLINTSNSFEDGYNKTLLQVDGSGNIDKSGIIRPNSGEAPQYPEAALNLGGNLDIWSGLAVQAIVPVRVADVIAQALSQGVTFISLLYGIIGLFIIGINLMLYKRFFDIAYSKMHN